MPRKKAKQEDEDKKEEIHPDFSSGSVASSTSNEYTVDVEPEEEAPEIVQSEDVYNELNNTDEPTSDNLIQEEEEPSDNLIDEEESSDELTEEDLKNMVTGEADEIEEEEILEEAPAIIQEPVLDFASDNSDEHIKTLEELNAEQEYQRRVKRNQFLMEYLKNINRSIDEVSDKKSIDPMQGREFLNEYIAKVKETVFNKRYPDDVIRFYNEGIKEESNRIRMYHVDHLKPLVKKYARYDVNANIERLNSKEGDKFNSNSSVSYEDNPLLNTSHQTSVIQPSSSSDFNDIDKLFDGITSLQLIRFGLYNVFGQAARVKIGNMIGMNPTPYLEDEQKLKNLIVMATGKPQHAEYFIQWLKTNARYVTGPEGFLRASISSPAGNSQMYGGGGSSPLYQNGHGGGGGTASYPSSDMDDYYYQQGIYIRGYPPNHPINIQNLKEYREEKANEKQLKAMDQRLRSAIQMKMLETFDSVGGNKNNNSFLTPETLFLMGMGRYRQSGTDETGKPVMVFEPSFGAFGGAPQQGQGGGTDSMASMMGAFKEMVGFMATIQNQNKQPDLMSQFIQVMMQKAFQPESNRMEEVLKSFEVFQKLKGPEVPAMNGPATDPEVLIKTKRMELDRDFGMKRLQLQEKELDLQRERLAQQDKEAQQNLQTLMDGVGQVVPMAANLVQQFFMGNRGGGGIMGGVQGGIPGMQPGQGVQQPGQGTNPAELILKMEYEKQRRAAEEEAYRKRMEWEEELRRKNAEAAMMQQQPVRETEKIVIKEPVVQQQQQRSSGEDYDENDFTNLPINKLENIIREADMHTRKLQKYKAAVESALQNKLLTEDYGMFEQPVQQVITPPQEPKQEIVTQETVIERTKDFAEMLDEVPESEHDPDWDAPEEVNIDDQTGGEEKESVEI